MSSTTSSGTRSCRTARATHLTALGFHDEVRYHNGEAVETLRNSTDGPFDLIFNDIDKHGYPAALPVIEERLRPGGVLIIDNMIWHNRIFDCERSDAGHAGRPRGHESVDDEPELDRVARADPRRDDRRGPEVAPRYSSRCTVVGENAGRQTATYSAPSAPGVL